MAVPRLRNDSRQVDINVTATAGYFVVCAVLYLPPQGSVALFAVHRVAEQDQKRL